MGEDVIWAGYEDGAFLSSHRLVSVMRHTGDSAYGPATNRIVRSRIIADCYVVEGVVTEEWLARDQAAFARCLGLDPRALARQMAADDIRRTGAVQVFMPEHDRPGRYRPQVQDGPDVARYADGYRQIWGLKDLSAIKDLYFHGAALAAPGGTHHHGHLDIDRFALGYLASFPDAVFKVGQRDGKHRPRPGGAGRDALVPAWKHIWDSVISGSRRAPRFYVMGFSHAEFR